MEILRVLNMINIRTFLTMLILCSHIRAKKLCDVRVWYLNIFTADIFNRDMTEEQLSLRENIEGFVLNAADNRNSKMVDCNTLYMYNEMLKEQFDYEGLPLKETDSDQLANTNNDRLPKSENINTDSEDKDENETNESSDKYQNIHDTTEYDNTGEDSASLNDSDLSDIHSDEPDNTDFDEIQTGNDYDVDKTDRDNEEIVEMKDTYYNSETINESSRNTFKHKPIPLGVCWAFGCSKYDMLIPEGDQYGKKNVDYSLGTHAKNRKLQLKKNKRRFDSENKCTLLIFYETLLRNIHCLNNYSLESEHSPSSRNSERIVEQMDNQNTAGSSEIDKKDQSITKSLDEEMEAYDYVDGQNMHIATNEDTFNSEQTENTILEDDFSDELFWNDFDDENNDNTDTNEDNVVTENIIPNHSSSLKNKDTNHRMNTLSKDKNEAGSTKETINSLKEFEDLIERRATKYFMKIQNLEVMIMKLENKLLSEAMGKQNYSSTITKLENHILKLENELLKINKNYQTLQEEADTMSKRQNKYLELAYKQTHGENRELPDYSSKSKELITQHQSKLQELAFVLKNQSRAMLMMQEKFENLEEQNRQLHQMVMNQTIFMTTIIKTVQDLSEQNILNQKEIMALRKMIDEKEIAPKTNSQKDSQLNIIDELESLLFQNRNENSYSPQTDKEPIKVDEFEPSEKHLENEVMRTNANTNKDIVSSWCPKSANSCPQCQMISVTKTNCIPFQFIIWSSDILRNDYAQNLAEDKTVSKTASQHGHHERDTKTKPDPDREEQKQDIVDLSNAKAVLESHDEGTSAESKYTYKEQDNYDENKDESDKDRASKTNDGNQSIQLQTHSNSESKPDDREALYQLVGYDKEGKPVYKMQNIEEDKPTPEAEKQTNNEETNDNINTKDKSNIINDKHVESDPNNVQDEKQNIVDDKSTVSKEQDDLLSLKQTESESKEATEVKGVLNKNSMSQNSDTNTNHKQSQDEHVDDNTKTAQLDDNNSSNEIKDKVLGQKDDASKPDKDELIIQEKDNEANPGEKKSDNIETVTKDENSNSMKMSETKDNPEKSGVKDSDKLHNKEQIPKEVKKENVMTDSDNGKGNKQDTNKDVPNTTSKANDNKAQENVETSKKGTSVKDTQKNETLSSTKSKEPENKSKEKKVPLYLKTNTGRQSEAKDCYDHYSRGDRRDGIYKIKPIASEKSIEVFCDMRKGGWTVIQRRQDGSTNFFQDWDNYKKGFGGLYGEHWLGNDNIHLLTNQDYYKLRVSLMNWDKEKKYAEFDYFIVENEDEGYRLNIDGYSGDAGDGFTKHDGNKFSTKDVDNDKLVKEMGGSCAKRFNGAGWYYKCYASNLNGKFYKGGTIPEKKYDGVTWKPWTGPNYSLKKVEMKIIPASVKT